jgi:hypothetical protein
MSLNNYYFAEAPVKDISQTYIDDDFNEVTPSYNPSVSNGLVNIYEDCYNDIKSDVWKWVNDVTGENERRKKLDFFYSFKTIKIVDEKCLVLIPPNKFSGGGGGKNTKGLKKGNKNISVKSVKTAINNLFLLSDWKKYKGKLVKKRNGKYIVKQKFFYRVQLITLTARHDGELFDFSSKIWRAWRDLYLILKRKFPKILYVLSKETHKDGYIHLHILTNIGFIRYEKITKWWQKCLKKYGLVCNNSAVDVTPIDESKGLKAAVKYVSKYLIKQQEKREKQGGNINGFFATYSKGLREKLKVRVANLSPEQLEKLFNKIKKRIEIESEYLEGNINVIILNSNINEMQFFKEVIKNLKQKIYGNKKRRQFATNTGEQKKCQYLQSSFI